MGLFNGEWRPRWSGDFTLDANVNLQIAAANLGGMGEGVESYAKLLEGIAEDWRTNAKNLFGCRGMVSGTRTDGRHNLNTHHTLGGFPGFFWTAGAQWLVTPLYEHYLVTGDKADHSCQRRAVVMHLRLFHPSLAVTVAEEGQHLIERLCWIVQDIREGSALPILGEVAS